MVADQREVQTVLLGELFVRFNGVHANAYNLCPESCYRLELVSETAGFHRATFGIILRVEVKHHIPLSNVIFQTNLSVFGRLAFEIRCRVTNLWPCFHW